MTPEQLTQIASDYEKQGFVSGVQILSDQSAANHRRRLEEAESKIGPLHYKVKIHTVLQSPLELATNPLLLDIVEQMIGPDILLYNATYIIKEPHTDAHVSWHQDLTYWGLSHDDQVAVWLALSPATRESGCMRMVPESHLNGQIEHHTTIDDSNVLFQGQTVNDVAEADAVFCELQPGQASFHHGWTLHASMPNHSDDRRIGLNINYFAPHMRQLKDPHDTALLVRGTDKHNHFRKDIPATADLEPAALARLARLNEHYKSIAGT